jgi:hypothetical protein
MIPATNKLVRAGGALLKHTVKMRMAELDVALLIEIEDRADRISSWAFDRRIRRIEQMYGPRRSLGDRPGQYVNLTGIKTLSVEVAEDPGDSMEFVEVGFQFEPHPAVQRYVNAEQRAHERAPQPPETK